MNKALLPLALAATLFASPVCADEAGPRYVKTTGTVRVTIPADSAQLSVSVSVLASTLDASNSRLDAAIKAFQAELSRLSIAPTAATLTNRSARKIWRDYSSRSDLLGYRTSVDVTVSIDDISKLTPLINYIGLHEEYSASPPTLLSSKTGEERKAVLASALRIARDKAEIIADAGGVKLGALLNASETGVEPNLLGFQSDPNANTITQASASAPGPTDNQPAVPAGDHVITIFVRILATFALAGG